MPNRALPASETSTARKNNGTTGYLIPKEADETTVQAAKVVGIVFQTDKSRIGAKEKREVRRRR